ncbi:MAG TPA: hypothetical protein PKA91_16365, partial [Leptospiraceae bacterium]|nr:hypothetical protein [Leptospiraceae bacterium]
MTGSIQNSTEKSPSDGHSSRGEESSILFSGLMTAREKVADSTDPIARKQVQEIDNQLVQLLPAPLRKNLPKVDGRYDATVLLPRVAAEIHK